MPALMFAGKVIPLLFENDDCLVFNKPPGLPVQGGKGVGVSLDSLLAAAFPERPLLVHRLDRDTSGIILVARGREAAARLSAALSRAPGGGPPVRKLYRAICAGVPPRREGVIETSLPEKGRVKAAKTFYCLLESAPLPALPGESRPACFLELELATGRTHQIRRHLASIGCPVLGDSVHGDFALNKRLRKLPGLAKSLLFLHAFRLVIPPSPLFPPGLDLQAPPPGYFDALTPLTKGSKGSRE